MTFTNSRFVNPVKGHAPEIDFTIGEAQPLGMEGTDEKLVDAKAIGARLRATRRALELDQRSLCRETDIGESAYNQYELGNRPLTIGPAIKLCRRFGLTLDWLYRGDPSGLPQRLAGQLTRYRILENPVRGVAEPEPPAYRSARRSRRSSTGTNG